MQYDDEKDYIMRMIKEVARILFSLMLKQEYVQVELPEENKYEVSGKTLNEYIEMVKQGKINQAENVMLEDIDYKNNEEVTAATYFYQYLGKKGKDFLERNNYSEEEVLDGLKQLAKNAGYGEICDLIEQD